MCRVAHGHRVTLEKLQAACSGTRVHSLDRTAEGRTGPLLWCTLTAVVRGFVAYSLYGSVHRSGSRS